MERMTFAGYLDENPKTVHGLAKPSLSKIPPVALLHMAQAMMNGADKYGPYNWRTKTVSASIYVDAAMRHLLAWHDGEENASDSGVHHLGHAMACCAILLDAAASGRLNDNRPEPGQFSALLPAMTKPLGGS